MADRERWRDEDQFRFRDDDWDRDYGRRRESARDYGRPRGEFERGSADDRGYGDRYGHGRDYGARGRLSDEDERGFGGRERDFGESAGYGRGGSARDWRDVVGEERGSGAMERAFGRGFGRGYGTPDYGDERVGRDRSWSERSGRERDERGFLERAGEEVASWFGDDEATRRRRQDAPSGEAGAQHHRGRGPRNYQRSDERIREDVNDRLTDDPHLDASNIEVSVENREVTLTGTVRNRFEKRHAEDIADGVSGVVHVQNNLRVQASGQSEGSPPAGQNQRTTGGALP